MNARKGLIRPYTSQFSFLSRVLDAGCILLAMAGVEFLFLVGSGFDTEFWVAAFAACLLFFINSDFTDLYRSWRIESITSELSQVVACWSFSFLPVLLFGAMLTKTSELFAWPVYAIWFTATVALLAGWRLCVRTGLRFARRNGFNTRSVAIAGSGELAQVVHDRLTYASWSGYVFAGYYDDRHERVIREDDRRQESPQGAVTPEGDFQTLVERAEAGELDCVYIAMPMYAEKRIARLAQQLSNSATSVYVVPDVFVFDLLHSHTVDIGGLPAISLVGEPHGGMRGALKRLEDLVGAALILTVISPLMLCIAAAVKLTSPGPIIFKQTRYGIDGKPIKVWKFRSMTVLEDGDDFVQAKKNDRRLTPIGGFLRSTSLDELPQFINVLQGRMSIVGPRPHAVAHNEEFRRKLPKYMRRHRIKPGITGWAQVNGWRGETDTVEKMERRLEHDLHYINHWSVWWDVKIIIKTAVGGFRGKNAY
jgi:putative colanic acid biosynthesis UDP-glucose lipid carrier transferase